MLLEQHISWPTRRCTPCCSSRHLAAKSASLPHCFTRFPKCFPLVLQPGKQQPCGKTEPEVTQRQRFRLLSLSHTSHRKHWHKSRHGPDPNSHVPHAFATEMRVLLTSQHEESQHDTYRHVRRQKAHLLPVCTYSDSRINRSSAPVTGQEPHHLHLVGQTREQGGFNFSAFPAAAPEPSSSAVPQAQMKRKSLPVYRNTTN